MESLDAHYPFSAEAAESGVYHELCAWGPTRNGAVSAMGNGIHDLYRFAIEMSPVMPWVTDRGGNVVEMDSRMEAALGIVRGDCLGTALRRRFHPDDSIMVENKWGAAQTDKRPVDVDLRVRLHGSEYHWSRLRSAPRLDHRGEVLYWYGTLEDFHEPTAAEAIRWAADHDELTGLLNRTAFMHRLRAAFGRVRVDRTGLAVMLFDIGRLQAVNERLGHECGDELLRQVASRLGGNIPAGALVARTGGDEFAVLMECALPDDSEPVLTQLLAVLETPFELDGGSHRLDGAVGVAAYPRDATSAEDLYRSADLALSEAKAGSRVVRHFDSAMRQRHQLRLSACAVVRDALERGSVFPFYQPQVDLRTGRVIGFEALLRWEHRRSGVQSAATVASAFADDALATALDRHMFDRIAADMRTWRAAGIDFGRIAINTSVVRFRSGDVAGELLQRVAKSGLHPSLFELEITENVLIGRNPERLAGDLDRLRAAGMTVALDDFGTGFASLIHLKQFTIDTLKIDRSFVQNIDDRTNGAVVSALVRLGKRLAIRTVAEGVETPAQQEELRGRGCDLGQGFLYSPAVPASAVAEMVAARAV